jgi:hypothetical protein
MPTYYEDGAALDVTILEDMSNDEFERYRLKVNAVLRSSRIVKDPEIGSEFTCDRLKNCGYAAGMWDLEK